MPTFEVRLPITGVVMVEVEADDEASAIEAALESEDLTIDNVETWEAHKQVEEGNVRYGELGRAEAYRVD